MLRWLVLLTASFCPLFASTTSAHAVLIGFEFTGTVSFANPRAKPYGITFTATTPVSGEFIYDTTSAPVAITHGLRYPQHYPSGFVVNIGAHTFAADHYVIDIGDDIPHPNGTFRDSFSVEFRSDIAELLGTSLMVDGIPQFSGKLQLTHGGPSTLYSDASLPTDLNPSSFSSSLGILQGTPSGAVGVLFTEISLSQFEVPSGVPEPSANLLVGLGLIAGLLEIWRRRHATLRFRTAHS